MLSQAINYDIIAIIHCAIIINKDSFTPDPVRCVAYCVAPRSTATRRTATRQSGVNKT